MLYNKNNTINVQITNELTITETRWLLTVLQKLINVFYKTNKLYINYL